MTAGVERRDTLNLFFFDVPREHSFACMVLRSIAGINTQGFVSIGEGFNFSTVEVENKIHW